MLTKGMSIRTTLCRNTVVVEYMIARSRCLELGLVAYPQHTPNGALAARSAREPGHAAAPQNVYTDDCNMYDFKEAQSKVHVTGSRTPLTFTVSTPAAPRVHPDSTSAGVDQEINSAPPWT
eukprot:3415285-Amphidinium_carterae.1